MPIIKVKEPFSATIRGRVRHFHPGEHELTPAELKHWRIQGVLAQGRAELLPADQAQDTPGQVPDGAKAPGPPAPLADMTKKQLLARAEALGLDIPPSATKAVILAAILKKTGN